MRWSRPFIAALFLQPVVACSCKPTTQVVQLSPPKPPANSLKPCPPLPRPDERDLGEMVQWADIVIPIYYDCAIRHEGLIKAAR